MSKTAVYECAARFGDCYFNGFEERGCCACSPSGFPNCALAGIMALALVRPKEGWRSFGMKTLCGDYKGRNIPRSIGIGTRHRLILIAYLLPDNVFDCFLELFVIEATLIIADRNDTFQNLVPVENLLRKLDVFVDALVDRLF